MTTIPVVWHTYEPGTLARGYFDQAMLEDLFSGSLWTPPNPFTFEHHEEDWPYAEGAVWVVPGRHNAVHVDALNADTAKYDWVLYVLTGDEAAEFPWHKLTHPNRRVWAMGARPTNHDGVDMALGSGYAPGTRTYLASLPPYEGRMIDWAFCGQITHERRQQFALAARPVASGRLVETREFAAHLAGKGLPQPDYLALLTHAKMAPCPSGPVSPDSFRLYEALECGCVPLADAGTPLGADPEYWTWLHPGAPFPQAHHWDAFGEILSDVLARWPLNANETGAWWTQEKRRIAWRLRDDVALLGGEAEAGTPDDQITVVMPTSPGPDQPGTGIIEATVASVRAHLPYAEIIVTCDPPRPELAHRAAAWGAYVRRLLWLAQHRWHNVMVWLRPTWGHQANVVRDALAFVRTPHVLLVEYDAPLVADRPIDWDACIAMLEEGRANVVRFYHDGPYIHPDHLHVQVGPAQTHHGRPFIPSLQFSARPHLAPTWWYRDVLERFFPERSRTMIEDVLYGVILRRGDRDWARWRLWVYGDDRPDGNIQRSYHLDGRGGDPKYPMQP